MSNPSGPVGYRGSITPVGSLLLLGLREGLGVQTWSFPSPCWEHGKRVFFFLAGLMAVSYNVSALENARKRWLPAGTGRSRPLPALQRSDFCSKVAAASASPLDRELGWVWVQGLDSAPRLFRSMNSYGAPPSPRDRLARSPTSCVTLGKVFNCTEVISPSENGRMILISSGCWNINAKI